MSRRVSNDSSWAACGASSSSLWTKESCPPLQFVATSFREYYYQKSWLKETGMKMPWLEDVEDRILEWRECGGKGRWRQECITETRRREGLIMVLDLKSPFVQWHHNQSTHLLCGFLSQNFKGAKVQQNTVANTGGCEGKWAKSYLGRIFKRSLKEDRISIAQIFELIPWAWVESHGNVFPR